MVSRRSHGTKYLGHVPVYHGIGGSQSSSYGFESDVKRVATHDGIRIEGGTAALAGRLYLLDVRQVMHFGDPPLDIGVGLEWNELLSLTTGFEGLHDGFEPGRAFWMLLSSMVLEVIWMIYQTDVHTFLLAKWVNSRKGAKVVYRALSRPATLSRLRRTNNVCGR
jgi:hypothetical protein